MSTFTFYETHWICALRNNIPLKPLLRIIATFPLQKDRRGKIRLKELKQQGKGERKEERSTYTYEREVLVQKKFSIKDHKLKKKSTTAMHLLWWNCHWTHSKCLLQCFASLRYIVFWMDSVTGDESSLEGETNFGDILKVTQNQV